MKIAIVSACLALSVFAGASFAADPPTKSPTAASPPGRRAIDQLENAWPGHPEWLAMLVDILEGSQLGPDDGWFRKAKAQTRHTWDSTRPRLDKDGDGRVSRAEFPGPVADFGRLDRDHDAFLTASDFDFSAHALAPSPGMMLFYRADRDGNGKVTREEFDASFPRPSTATAIKASSRRLGPDRGDGLDIDGFEQSAPAPHRGGSVDAAGLRR